MKKLKKTTLRLNKEVITALNQNDLRNVLGGQNTDTKVSDMWVTKDIECETYRQGCPSNYTCMLESREICLETNNCKPASKEFTCLSTVRPCPLPQDFQ